MHSSEQACKLWQLTHRLAVTKEQSKGWEEVCETEEKEAGLGGQQEHLMEILLNLGKLFLQIWNRYLFKILANSREITIE